MNSKELRGLMEAYAEVYAPQQIDELSVNKMLAYKKKAEKNRGELNKKWDQGTATYREKMRVLGREEGEERASRRIEKKTGKHPYDMNALDKLKASVKKEDLDIFDVVLEFLQAEGFAETLEEAEWMMANMIDEESIDIILGEAIYSEKGKAKAAEMIAKRSTPSGRAKSGKGANVAHIRQIRGSGRGDFDREGLGGTPMTRTMAKNPIKKQNYVGTGNKAARRAGLTPTREKPNAWKEEFEFWVDALVEEGYDLSGYTWDEMYEFYLDEASRRDEFTRAAIARNSGRKGGITFEPGPNWDPSANRGRGAHLNPKQKEKQRRKALRQEEFVGEAQHARENPEKYEREQSKKSAPVRGEKTPMPPRGDKRREDFEKWYAKQMGR